MAETLSMSLTSLDVGFDVRAQDTPVKIPAAERLEVRYHPYREDCRSVATVVGSRRQVVHTLRNAGYKIGRSK